MASDTGGGNGTQDGGTYDPNQPISVLGNLPFPSQWSVSGGSDAAAGNQPSVLGDALNPRPWTPADNSLTRRLVDAFQDTGQVSKVYFNDPQIRGVMPWPEYDDHLHVQLKP